MPDRALDNAVLFGQSLRVPHPQSEELFRLADAGDAAGVLSIVTLDDIAREWCELTAADMARPEDDELSELRSDRWPMWFFYNCLGQVPQLHRELFVKLVAAAPNDDVLSAIGAGPFEDWLYSSPDEIHWLEAEASKNPRFQRALDDMCF